MQSPLKVLIIEDAPADAGLIARELKKAGIDHQMTRVETQPDFLRTLETFAPDIILSDFTMPHFDGLTALKVAREKAPDTPFIFVSGTIGEEVAIESLKRGAADYILKTNLKRLGPAVERALQDVEERRARLTAERQLNETRIRFELFMRHLPGAAFIKDPQGRYQFVNWSWEEIRGRKMADVLGRTDGNLWPELAAQLENNDRLVIDRNDALRSIETFPRPDGVHHYLVHKFPIRDRNGQPMLVGGIAIDYTDRLRAEEKVARLSRIHAVLSGINSLIVRVRDRQELFKEACRIAVEQGGFGIAWIGTLDPNTLDVIPVACAGIDRELLKFDKFTARSDVPAGQGAVGRAIRGKRLAIIHDFTSAPYAGGTFRKEAIRRGYRSLAVFPLLVDDSVVGNLALFAQEANFFTDDELKLLDQLAGDVSYALHAIARQEKLDKLSRIRAVSSEINAAIVRIRERETLLRETCRIAAERGKFRLVWIASLDIEQQEVRPVAWVGFSPDAARSVSWTTIDAARGTLSEAIQTRRLAINNDIEVGLPGGVLRQEAISKGCLSTACMPLVVDDKVVALCVLFAPGQGFFDTDELALLDELAADVSFALDHIAKEEKLNYLAYYDALTGLPNRTLFLERVNQFMRSAQQGNGRLALVLLDLQRFRAINDALGRQTSDALLKLVARRMQECLGERGWNARIGGNTFAVVLSDIKQETDVAHMLEGCVFEFLRQPFMVENTELRLAARCGVALFPGDGNDADSLLRNAEAALKKAKDSGDRYLFYAPQMNARVAEQLNLENRLHVALTARQFVLHYQPKVESRSGQVIGLEALIRWNNPGLGMVSPAEFVPILEETGQILEVGMWVLQQAASDYRQWQARGLKPPPIAVNISALQLRQNDFAERVQTAVRGANGEMPAIDLEITESVIMRDIEQVILKLAAIRALGMGIAIDDFGTGHSSLSYLARLPVNALKIDRSFIKHMDSSAEHMTIVTSVISLAHSLNLKVIAEGVETKEQWNLLKLLKCDELQGYVFSRPQPAEAVEAMFDRAG